MSGGLSSLRRGKGKSGLTSKGGSEGEAPIDLDMTPMMNMLIILISFLVTMVVFTHLAVIKFNLPPSGAGEGQAETPGDSVPHPEVDITVLISENGFQVIGEGRKLDPIPKNSKGYDFGRLAQFMKSLKAEYPNAESVVLLIDSTIIYEDIISSMDVVRENQFPNVLLSGGVYQ